MGGWDTLPSMHASVPSAVLSVLVLVACDGSEPPPPSYTPDLSGREAPLQQCLQQACLPATDADSFATCEAERCARSEATWAIEPSQIRYDREGGILTVDVAVQHTPARYGAVDIPHGEEAWLGVTVLTRAGEDIDLAVQTVFPDQISAPFTFSAEVGGEVRDIIFGLWGKKIEPCEVDRSGCRMFGFVLDESLAAWPLGTYTDSPPPRQRIPDAGVTWVVQGAGAAPEVLRAAREKAALPLAAAVERFGFPLPEPEIRLAAAPRGPMLSVQYRDEHDQSIAQQVALRMGLEKDGAILVPDAPGDFVIEVGGAPASLACHRVQCSKASGEDLLACMAACP